MNLTRAMDLLRLASEEVPQGIYAIQKGNYIEMRNDPMTKTQLKKARREYQGRGFRVWCNGL